MDLVFGRIPGGIEVGGLDVKTDSITTDQCLYVIAAHTVIGGRAFRKAIAASGGCQAISGNLQ